MLNDTHGIPEHIDDVPTQRIIDTAKPLAISMRCRCGAEIGDVEPGLLRVIATRQGIYVVRCPSCTGRP